MIAAPDSGAPVRGPAAPFVEIGRLIGKKLHLPLVYRGIQEVLAREMPARNLYVAVLEDERTLRFPYYVDELETEDQLASYPKEGLTAFVIDQARTICMRREPELLKSVRIIGARPVDWLGTPLRARDGRVSGILAVQTYAQGESYGDRDIELLEFAAGQLSIALQLQLYDRDIAIERIASLVDDAGDITELYAGIHRIVTDLIPAAGTCFIIARVDAAAGRFRPVYWRDIHDDWDGMDWPIDRGFSSYIYRVLKGSFIYERGRTRLPPEYIPIGTPPFYWLGVPLKNGPEIVGIVIAQSYDEDNPVTREDEAMLSIVAPHITQAIRRTELFERTRQGTMPGFRP